MTKYLLVALSVLVISGCARYNSEKLTTQLSNCISGNTTRNGTINQDNLEECIKYAREISFIDYNG